MCFGENPLTDGSARWAAEKHLKSLGFCSTQLLETLLSFISTPEVVSLNRNLTKPQGLVCQEGLGSCDSAPHELMLAITHLLSVFVQKPICIHCVDTHKVLESLCISVHPATVLSVDSLDTEVGQLFYFSKSNGIFFRDQIKIKSLCVYWRIT